MPEKARTCWVISEDKAGMLNQARGLAESLAEKLAKRNVTLNIEYKLIAGKMPWKYLPNKLWPLGVFGVEIQNGEKFEAPWPDMIISCARKSAVPAREIMKRAAKENRKIFSIHIQRPHIDLANYDYVITPEHDQMQGDNIVTSIGSLGRVNRSLLAQAALDWEENFNKLPRPFVVVSIGGDSKVYKYQDEDFERLGRQLRKFQQEIGGSLLITSSRRTNEKRVDILKKQLVDIPNYYWDGQGENPYFGFLGLADYIITTCDSANMVSEACITGKPVYVFHVEPTRATKFTLFHNQMEMKGMTRQLGEDVISYTYPHFDETNRISDQLVEKLKW